MNSRTKYPIALPSNLQRIKQEVDQPEPELPVISIKADKRLDAPIICMLIAAGLPDSILVESYTNIFGFYYRVARVPYAYLGFDHIFNRLSKQLQTGVYLSDIKQLRTQKKRRYAWLVTFRLDPRTVLADDYAKYGEQQ
jgi:hypothetical protein